VLKPVPVLLLLITLTLFARQASASWILEIFGGSAHSFDTTLKIRDSSATEIDHKAEYETRPFEDAPYYAWRISYQRSIHSWSLELVHHKIYLKNLTPVIQEFEVSHGYNLLMLNYARKLGSLWLHAGGGVVVAYPHAQINGLITLGGYQVAGPAAQIAIGKRFDLNKRLFLAVEGKFTLGRASVDLGPEKAIASNAAFHGLAGLGIRFYS
jgi:hypothetical protein